MGRIKEGIRTTAQIGALFFAVGSVAGDALHHPHTTPTRPHASGYIACSGDTLTVDGTLYAPSILPPPGSVVEEVAIVQEDGHPHNIDATGIANACVFFDTRADEESALAALRQQLQTIYGQPVVMDVHDLSQAK